MNRILLTLGFICSCWVPAYAGTGPEPHPTPELLFRAESLRGKLGVRSADGKIERELKAGDPLQPGEELFAGKQGQAVLMLTENTLIEVQEETRLRLDSLVPGPAGEFTTRWTLQGGRILWQVQKLGPAHSAFEVDLGGMAATVSGSTFETTLEGDQTDLGVQDGEVAVMGPGPAEKVEGGSHLAFQRGLLQLRRRLDRSEKERFEGWKTLKAEARENRAKRLRKLNKPKPKRAKKKARTPSLPNPDAL